MSERTLKSYLLTIYHIFWKNDHYLLSRIGITASNSNKDLGTMTINEKLKWII